MRSLDPGSSWIQIEQSLLAVVFHFEDMRMTAYEDVGAFPMEAFQDPFPVFARPASDVGHPDPNPFEVEALILGSTFADLFIVDVAVYGAQLVIRPQFVEHLGTTDIASMPNFVHALEILVDLWVQITMRVRKETDAKHMEQNK